MGLQTTNPKSWSVAKYVVAVLWMEGRLGPSDIALQVKWTPGQVRGFYDREFKPPRALMKKDERQEILDFLKGWSGWFGVFIDARFEDRFHAKELKGERAARLRAEEAARPEQEKREPTKKELRRRAQEEEYRREQEMAERLRREDGMAVRGISTDALEWISANALGDRDESISDGGLASRDRRKEALKKFRTYIEGASISPLRAQDYEAVGGGGGPKLTLPEYRKYCIDMLGGARKAVPRPVFLMLEMIVVKDEFVWLRVPKGSKRALIYESIRYGADLLATYYRIIAPFEFKARWGVEFPDAGPMPTRESARADSAMTQDIVDQLTKATA